MSWPHQDSLEVCLVQSELESLRRDSESLNLRTGEVHHRVSFFRERSIAKPEIGAGKRFDFSLTVDNGKSRREYLIEVHGKQHYDPFFADTIWHSDSLKARWAKAANIALLVLSHHEVVEFHLEGKLMRRIKTFLQLPLTAVRRSDSRLELRPVPEQETAVV